MQQPEYPFAKLDDLVEVRLNPLAGADFEYIAKEDFAQIKTHFISECDRVWTNLKILVFGLLSDEKIRIAIGQHLLIITHLKTQIRANLAGPGGSSYSDFDYSVLIEQLDRLESLIRGRYALYCSDRPSEIIRYKILCSLSVDQIGLILRAADDTKLIQAKSLNLVFKSIVPYLSTSNKTDISFDSMRSSTYHPEAPDKEKAIAALEKMITKINDYR
jgi:hypothetical protein